MARLTSSQRDALAVLAGGAFLRSEQFTELDVGIAHRKTLVSLVERGLARPLSPGASTRVDGAWVEAPTHEWVTVATLAGVEAAAALIR